MATVGRTERRVRLPGLRYRRDKADLGRVTHVSRPLIGLLAATVLVFALYTVALKPGASSSGGGSNPGAYQAAIAKARGVQGVVNGAAARAVGTPALTATPTISTPAPSSTNATTHPSAKAKIPAATGSQAHASKAQANGKSTGSAPASSHSISAAAARFHTVQVALQQHKVLAVLFYNPASADDRAVASELSSISTHGGAVVKLAVPIQELASYSGLLSQDPINYSPTLVLIDRHGQADEIAGFADSFEINQRLAGVLGP
jgi:hypothetical protein